MTPWRHRRATPDDLSALVDLSTQLGYPSSHAQIEERLKALLPSDTDQVVVALDDSVVIAWIHGFLTRRLASDPWVELGGLVVDETYRGRGVGRRLVEAIEEWAAQLGVGKLRVRTRSERTASRAIYQRWGFTATKEQVVFDRTIDTSRY